MLQPTRGDEKPRPGFDNWHRQLDRPRACERAARTKMPGAFLNNACVGPEGARPRDGPSNGERSESIPPSPPYFKKSSYESTGFFFACCTCHPVSMVRASPGGRHKCLARATNISWTDRTPRPGYHRCCTHHPVSTVCASPGGRHKCLTRATIATLAVASPRCHPLSGR
ncbi:hypothetical protein EDF82_0214 [Raoultella sp. BIGb0399]|nr:hypothetical protein EDF82_0214 [Raoultella sp. BIGb0399]